MDGTSARAAVDTAYARDLIRYKARQLVAQGYLPRCDREDVEQELILHLLRQVHHFDPSRGSPSTFVDRVVDSAARMMLRHRKRLKRARGYATQSLDAASAEQSSNMTPALTVADLERRTCSASRDTAFERETAEVVSEALKRMPPHLREICLRLMIGTVTSVARELVISRRQIHNGIAKAREFFKDAGFEEF